MEHLPWSTGCLALQVTSTSQRGLLGREEVGETGAERERHWLWSPPLTGDEPQGRIHSNSGLRARRTSGLEPLPQQGKESQGLCTGLSETPHPCQAHPPPPSPPCLGPALWFQPAASVELSDS